MTSRREFLRNTGAIAMSSILVPGMLKGASLTGRAKSTDIGIQVYTTNSFMGKDPRVTFQKLADIGFKNIETAFNPIGPYYGMKPKELKSMIEGMGMNHMQQHNPGVILQRQGRNMFDDRSVYFRTVYGYKDLFVYLHVTLLR